jgi:hypothetical protein
MPPAPISVVEPGAPTNEQLAFGARITGEGTIEEFPNGEQPRKRRIPKPISIGTGEISERLRIAAEPVDAHATLARSHPAGPVPARSKSIITGPSAVTMTFRGSVHQADAER